jgi:hypothetical protein
MAMNIKGHKNLPGGKNPGICGRTNMRRDILKTPCFLENDVFTLQGKRTFS